MSLQLISVGCISGVTIILITLVILMDLPDVVLNRNLITSSDSNVNQKSVFNEYILFIRMYSGKKDIFYNDFLDTFKFFWPFSSIQANLLIVLDDENKLDHQFEIELRQTFESLFSNEIKYKYFNYYITFEEPDGEIYNNIGWNRQQWSMFWCDKFLDKLNISHQYKWIGFVDTDTMFTSLITPQTIFHNHTNKNNPKPIMICDLGFRGPFGWLGMKNTPKWFGKQEWFRNMDQFPVSFKLSHIQSFRDATVKHWFQNNYTNHHFDEIVEKILKQPPFMKRPVKGAKFFSQFTIFATYIWHYAQNNYEWYFIPSNMDEWHQRKKMNGVNKNERIEKILNYSELNIHNGEKESMVRIAAHESWTPTTKIQVIAKGYCFSIDWDSEYCQQLNDKLNLKYGLYNDLFEFEKYFKKIDFRNVWANDAFRNQSLRAQSKYYSDVKQILPNHHWHKHPVIENKTMLLS